MSIKINCFGDSVTEGMQMDGHHFAEYGKFPFPAALKTILTDKGYDADVTNYGHGGECVAEIAVRCGGIPCFVTEDIILKGDGTEASLGKKIKENGKISGTRLKVISGENEADDFSIYFTQLSHDTNPVYINGVACEMRIIDDCENVIKKLIPEGKDTLIPKGSLFFTADKRNADINIFYAGINDEKNLTLKAYTDILSKCGNLNGGKYLVLGCTHPIWNNWRDIQGESRYEIYKRACYNAFGNHFIDLYDEFSKNALDIALKCGLFQDKSEKELAIMREKLANHIIPEEFTFNGACEGDVHLSKEGYRVIAELLYERMKMLSYI